MMFLRRRYFALLVAAIPLLVGFGVLSQVVSEEGLIVSEEMLLEEALTSDALDLEEPALDELEEDTAADTNLVVEEEIPLDEIPLEELETGDETVDELVEEAIGDELIEEAPVVEEEAPGIEDELPVDEDLTVGDEAVDALVEEALGEPVLEEEEEAELLEESLDLVEELPEEELIEDVQPEDLEIVEAAPGEEEEEVEGLEELVVEALQGEELPEMGVEEAEEVDEGEIQDLTLLEEEVPLEVEGVEELPVELVERVEEAFGVEEEPPLEFVEEPVEEFPVESEPIELVEEPAEEPGFQEAVEAAVEEAIAEAPPAEPAVVGFPPEVAAVLGDVMGEEQARREGLEQHARDSLAGAQEALKGRRYKEAITLFQEARKYLQRPEMRPDLNRAIEGLGEAHYRYALLLERREARQDALSAAETAADFGHPKAEKLADRLRKPPPEEKPPPAKPRWAQEDLLREEDRISGLLSEGRQHYTVKEFDKAKEKFEGVLSIDPENTEAIRLLRKTARHKYDASSVELEATRDGMMADVRDTWNPRDYAEIKDTMDRIGQGPVKEEPIEVTRRMRILKKMENIQIPQIEFRQANIYTVIDELQDLSVEFDTTDIEEERGVNIILNLQAGREPGERTYGAEDDPFAEAGAGAADEVPPITFSARYISLRDTLKIVTDLAGLKYRVKGRVVMVVPLDAPEADIIVRMYPVKSSFRDRIPIPESFGAGGLGGDFQSLEPAGGGGEEPDWKKFFEEMGVEWPHGSSIKYVGAIGRLVVANTEENLTVFEDVLSLLDVIPHQIEIEARFVEVNQTDSSSMGFEFFLTDDWELAERSGQGGIPLASRERVSAMSDVAPERGGFTKGNRFISQLGVEQGGVADNVLTIAGILTNPELAFVLHMLEQKGFADLLSAPKVTTQAGQDAIIKVVTEYIYPTDFAVTPITGTDEAGNSVVVGGVVEPSGFETREVGVILEVAPEVSTENQMITLNMTPRVVSEPTWFNYGSEYTAPDGRVQQLNMQQPFFHTREVATSISIYNGATVVMGGMITEVRDDVDDKIPLFGDLPIIGRLFRSKYDYSRKRNLLIFVTARLVDPAGKPLQSISETLAEGRVSGTGAPEAATP